MAAALDRRGFRNRARTFEIELERRFQSILNDCKHLLHAFALGDGFGDVGKGDQEELAIRLNFEWISHGVSYLSPSCFLMLSTRPVPSSLLCIGRIEVLPFNSSFRCDPFEVPNVTPCRLSHRLNSVLFTYSI